MTERVTPEELRALIDSMGISQARAARLMGLTLRGVQRWLAGEREVHPTAVLFLRLYGGLKARGWSDADIEAALLPVPPKGA